MNTTTSIEVTFINDDGVEITLPSRWEICDNCDGEGTHVHDALRVVTSSDRDEWDDDEWEARQQGVYNVCCEACRGSGKVLVVDESRCDADDLEEYRAAQREHAAHEAEMRAERRFGC